MNEGHYPWVPLRRIEPWPETPAAVRLDERPFTHVQPPVPFPASEGTEHLSLRCVGSPTGAVTCLLSYAAPRYGQARHHATYRLVYYAHSSGYQMTSYNSVNRE